MYGRYYTWFYRAFVKSDFWQYQLVARILREVAALVTAHGFLHWLSQESKVLYKSSLVEHGTMLTPPLCQNGINMALTWYQLGLNSVPCWHYVCECNKVSCWCQNGISIIWSRHNLASTLFHLGTCHLLITVGQLDQSGTMLIVGSKRPSWTSASKESEKPLRSDYWN